ncbi:MAG: hypothetical protein R3C20_02255 [Planctomycetaceae bacterium]
MRLTLRTLLAYLDDRLPPANAKEIGQKIAKSPFATELAERIREVVRRRRLAATSESVRMIDANLVAEYLDDQLTPELVARIEQEILKSDVNLAEVAATHQTIGLLRDPVPLESRMRDRLYSMDPAGKVRQPARQSSNNGSVEKNAADPKPATPAPEWTPQAARPAASRRFPVLILGAMALVWLGFVITDQHLTSPPGPDPDGPLLAANHAGEAAGLPPGSDGNDKATDVDSDVETDIAATPANPTDNGDPFPAIPADSTQVASAPGMTPSVSEPKPVGQQPAANANPPGNAAMTNVASKEAGSLPVGADNSVGGTQPDNSVPDPVRSTVQHRVTVRDDYGMLLGRNQDSGEWMRLLRFAPNNSLDQLRLRDWRSDVEGVALAMPEDFSATVSLDESGWKMLVPGGSVFRLINAEPSGLVPVEGRFLLSREPSNIADDASVPVVLQFGKGQVELSLGTADTKVALHVVPVRNDIIAPAVSSEVANDTIDDELIPWDSDFHVQAFVVEGAIRLSHAATESSLELTKTQSAFWKSLDDGSVAELHLADAAERGAIMDWVNDVTSPPVPQETEILDQISAAFASSETISEPALQHYSDRNPLIGSAAVRVVAASRDVSTLMTILLQSEEELVRRAAIDGLQKIALQTEAGSQLVRRNLENRLPMNEVPVLFKLISGLSSDEFRSPDICAELVVLLSSDRLATRELAFYRMEQIVGDRYGYHADADSGRRRESIRRWQRYIDRNDGKLIP